MPELKVVTGSFPGGGDNGSEPPENADMLARLAAIEARIDAIVPNLATKADLEQKSSEVIRWIVGTAIALGTAGITIMTFVLNNATPRAPTAQLAPIVIQVPTAPPSPSAPPAKP